MCRDLEPIMAMLQALAKDTPRSVKERLPAAEKAIKSWLAQTNDLSERARMLRDLDGKVAAVEVDDFATGLRELIGQQLNTLAAGSEP
jgi:ubiquinone biosynthesis protein UbiJ